MKAKEREALLAALQARFEQNMRRHEAVAWSQVQARLTAQAGALDALSAMEASGGEPDVVTFPEQGEALCFCDCVAESPAGRRSLCYDRAALDARKQNKPQGSAQEMAAQLGIALLTEAQYRHLQTLGAFDTKTSSWIATPEDVRQLGGALFCDRRFGRVFVYHNGADSYYAARGFRGLLRC